jgi:lysophospholipase
LADAAPLIATPTAPIPAGGAAEWVAGAGGVRLRAALFAPAGKPRGSVVLSPGRSEWIEKYFEVVGELLARGFAVLVHDWRGQGLSHRALADQSLGHARGYAEFVDDHALLLAAFEDRLPRPWIALGHSMGGCLGLTVLACGETRFSAAIFSAPMLGLRLGGMPRGLGRALAATMTRLGMAERPFMRAGPPETFETNILTHDRARWARSQAQVAACPALGLGPPTWGWVDFAWARRRGDRQSGGHRLGRRRAPDRQRRPAPRRRPPPPRPPGHHRRRLSRNPDGNRPPPRPLLARIRHARGRDRGLRSPLAATRATPPTVIPGRNTSLH